MDTLAPTQVSLPNRFSIGAINTENRAGVNKMAQGEQKSLKTEQRNG